MRTRSATHTLCGLLFLVVLVSSVGAASPARAVDVVDTWKYTLRRPAKGWTSATFDATAAKGGWKTGHGGFGIRSTPGSRVGTTWRSADIWLRKEFVLSKVPATPALLIHHDEDVEVFINGEEVARRDKWSTEYFVIPLGEKGRKALRVGKNLLAVHCHQTSGGQFIDVHVVDATSVPKLPRPKRDPKPFQSQLITEWGAKVTAENAWREHPRPQMVRKSWQNLNGSWSYGVTKADARVLPKTWAGKILVPFCLESKLGGVSRYLEPDEALWYHREFTLSSATSGSGRLLLHFEAVDYRCEVFVNSRSVGTHRGGHTPFSFDVTDVVNDGSNSLVVRVEDDTEGYQLRGKQVFEARGIWYTQVSGIWQTVWLERVGDSYIEDLGITTDAATGTIRIRPDVAGSTLVRSVRAIVRDGDREVASGESAPTGELTIAVPSAKLWSPRSPQLYDLEITLLGANAETIDRVRSYAGIRSVSKRRDKDGHWRFTLNGEEIFHWGPLDQGWWPDGLLTPPSDEGMRFDIEFLKAAGFNMIRKHIKVEPRRYYYHCDRIGIMVWQDQVSAGNNPPWTRLKPEPKDADWPAEHHEQYLVELDRMIDALESHPSIVVWVPFNEAWGQHRTMEVGRWTVKRDPTRLVNVASGGNFWPVGDIVDAHAYPHPSFPFDNKRFAEFIHVMGEFGGHGYPVRDHLWDSSRRNWGYGGLPKNKDEYKARYLQSLDMLDALRRRGIAAGVYTQTTDVEGEINGLLTYDRKVIKIPAKELAKLHERLFR